MNNTINTGTNPLYNPPQNSNQPVNNPPPIIATVANQVLSAPTTSNPRTKRKAVVLENPPLPSHEIRFLNKSSDTKDDLYLARELSPKKHLWHKESIEDTLTLIRRVFTYYPTYKKILDNPADLLKNILNHFTDTRTSADYKIFLSLVHLLVRIDGEPLFKEEKIRTMLIRLVKNLSYKDKGMLIHYMTLLNTSYGQIVRELLAPHLIYWTPWSRERFGTELQWLSIEEELNRIKLVAKGMEEAGKESFGLSRLNADKGALFYLFNDESSVLSACQSVLEYCDILLEKHRLGEEIDIPRYYFSSLIPPHHENDKSGKHHSTFPHQMLVGEKAKIHPRQESYQSQMLGTFVSTAITPEFFSETALGLMGAAINTLGPDKIIALSYGMDNRNKESEYHYQIKNHVPVGFTNSKRTTLATIVTSSYLEQTHIINEANVKCYIQGMLEAYVFQQVKNQAIPTYIPLHHAEYKEMLLSSVQNLEQLALIKKKFLPSTPPVAVYEIRFRLLTKNITSLSKGYLDNNFLKELLELSERHPQKCREEMLRLFPVPLNPSGYSATCQENKKLRAMYIKVLHQSFPYIYGPPLERHVWYDHSVNNEAQTLFGTVVGLNPLLLFNSVSIQMMLFHYASKIKLDPVTQKINPAYSEEVKSQIFFNLLTLEILLSSVVYEPQKEMLLTPYTLPDGTKTSVLIDYNTFDSQPYDGVNVRLHENDPFYLYQILTSLSKFECEKIKNLLLKPHAETNNTSRAFKGLFTDIGKAIQQRYFSQNDQRPSNIPERINNSGLNLLLNSDLPSEEILKGTNYLTEQYLPSRNPPEYKASPQESYLNHFYMAKNSKFRRQIWGALQEIDFHLLETPLQEHEEVHPIAENAIRLLLGNQVQKAIQLPLSKLERIRLFRILNQKEFSTLPYTNPAALFDLPLSQTAKSILEQAKEHAIKQMENLSEDKKYQDWLAHIEHRLKKISLGQEVLLGSYFSGTNPIRNNIVLFQRSLPENPIGWIACPRYIEIFQINATIETGWPFNEITPVVTNPLELTSHGNIKPFASYTIGYHNDPKALIPIMTPDVARLEHDFLLSIEGLIPIPSHEQPNLLDEEP